MGRKRADVLRLPVAFHERQWFYIGYTTDLNRRLSEHTRGASLATKSRGSWKIIYYEAYTEREDPKPNARVKRSASRVEGTA